MKQILSSKVVFEASQLILALHEAASALRVSKTPAETYVTINSDAVRVTLVEETLTDGSKVFNIELAEATKS